MLLPERDSGKPSTPAPGTPGPRSPSAAGSAAGGLAPRADARLYEFDACLPGATTQGDLYESCGVDELVAAALDGYCSTVFAFGQTGSGKVRLCAVCVIAERYILGVHNYVRGYYVRGFAHGACVTD